MVCPDGGWVRCGAVSAWVGYSGGGGAASADGARGGRVFVASVSVGVSHVGARRTRVYYVNESEPRQPVNVRLSAAGLRSIDAIAEDEARSRSDVIRILLAYAIRNRPKGWTK